MWGGLTVCGLRIAEKLYMGIRALRTAYEGGINYFDLAAGHGKAFPLWGEALCDVRKNGIGISVMKPFSGGQLLDAAQSPFRQALTPYQCIRYALDKPGVLTVLPGAQSVDEVKALLDYENQTEEALDYSVIGEFAPIEASGKCVYCNHCRPCPAGLDIGLINKYYDLALAGDGMAAEHYRKLEKNASDCIFCGHCDRRCPFHVHQSERMREIAACFQP